MSKRKMKKKMTKHIFMGENTSQNDSAFFKIKQSLSTLSPRSLPSMSKRKMKKKMTKHIFQDPKIPTLFPQNVNRQREKQSD